MQNMCLIILPLTPIDSHQLRIGTAGLPCLWVERVPLSQYQWICMAQSKMIMQSSFLKKPETGLSVSLSISFSVMVHVCVHVCVCYLKSYSCWYTDTHRATADPHSGLNLHPALPTTRHMGCVACMYLTWTLTQPVPQVTESGQQRDSRKRECVQGEASTPCTHSIVPLDFTCRTQS